MRKRAREIEIESEYKNEFNVGNFFNSLLDVCVFRSILVFFVLRRDI